MPASASPIAAIQRALDDHLKDFPALPDVAWEGTVYRPHPGRPYFATKTLARAQRMLGVGRESGIEHSGIYQISIFYPVGEGMENVAAAADAVADFFKPGTSIPVSAGGFLRVQVPRIPPAIDMPDWVMIPVQVNWFYHQL